MSKGIRLETISEEVGNSGNNYLFVVGINDYINFPKLRNAVKDVQEIRDVLLLKYTFENDYVTSLFDQEATKSKIISHFQKLRKRISNKDTLLILFSGHGFLNENGKGFWIPYDASQSLEGTFISNGEIMDQIEQVDSLHTLLVSDSCFSGSFFTSFRSPVIDKIRMRKSRWAIASGRSDEKVSDGFKNSPFAEFLIEFLLTNNSKLVTANALYEDIKLCVGRNSDQIPLGGPIYKVGDQGGEYVFELKMDVNSAWKEVNRRNTLEGFQAYIQRYSDSPFLEEAERKIEYLKEERESWQWFLSASLDELNKFIKKYENGNFHYEARKQQERLLETIDHFEKEEREQREWLFALKENTVESYEKFIEKYPKSELRQKAEKIVQRLVSVERDEELWNDTLSRMKNEKQPEKRQWGLTYYLSKYPHGKYATAAKRILQEIQEYLKASELKNLQALQKYLNDYPQGTFKNRVAKEINYLQVENRLNQVISSNSINKVTQFINECKIEDLKEKAAIFRKELLQPDENAYKEALVLNSKEAFKAYLGDFPNGAYSGQIKNKLEELEKTAFDQALENGTKEGFDIFIIDFPESNYVKQIKRKLEEIDEKAFKEAEKIDTIEAYENYAFNFTNGTYLNDAIQKIEKINTELINIKEEAERNELMGLKKDDYHTERLEFEKKFIRIQNDGQEIDHQSRDKKLQEPDPEEINRKEIVENESSRPQTNDEEMKRIEVFDNLIDIKSVKEEIQPREIDDELEAFKKALKSKLIENCEKYLASYPNSEFKEEIINRINELKNKKVRQSVLYIMLLLLIIMAVSLAIGFLK